MRGSYNKNSYRALLLISFLAVNVLILVGISKTWTYFNSGAERSDMLHLGTGVTRGSKAEVVWQEGRSGGRPVSRQERNEIEKGYLLAWRSMERSLASNSVEWAADRFTDKALHRLERQLIHNSQEGVTVKGVTLEHHPKIEFYSADGKLVVIRDDRLVQYRETFLDDALLTAGTDTLSYKFIFLLQDGNWRIRQLIKTTGVKTEDATEPAIINADALNNEIRGFNYYPRESAWNIFGPGFDPDPIRTDFDRISSMGFNTIRVFVPYQDFNQAGTSALGMIQLQQMMDIAEENDLGVMITLFDFYGNYDQGDWLATHRHAEHLVKFLKDHPALLAWDIKNEPDLDFKNRGQDNVVSWLKNIIPYVRKWDPDHPVTIGWSSPEAASLLEENVDFVSFHYYDSPADFQKRYHTLKKRVQKPILLQEFGYSSYSGLWNLYMGSEHKQGEYYRDMMQSIRAEKLPFLSWTLYDFEEIPGKVTGSLPWRKSPQGYFGVIDRQDNEKEAVQYLKSGK